MKKVIVMSSIISFLFYFLVLNVQANCNCNPGQACACTNVCQNPNQSSAYASTYSNINSTYHQQNIEQHNMNYASSSLTSNTTFFQGSSATTHIIGEEISRKTGNSFFEERERKQKIIKYLQIINLFAKII